MDNNMFLNTDEQREELYRLYVVENKTIEDVAAFLNRHVSTAHRILRKYKIKKTKEQKVNSQKNAYLKKYGVTNPSYVPSIINSRKETCLSRYHVDNYAKTDECKQRYIEHCNKKYNTNNAFASKEVKEKIKKTNLERYGAERYTQTEEYKEKVKKTNLEKYGVEYSSQREEVKEKMKSTCLEKYGVTNYSQTDEYKERFKVTCQEKYGVDNVFQAEDVKEKIKKTNLERYGVNNYFQTDEYKERAKEICFKKYGTENYSQTKEYKEKVKETCIKKYGTAYYTQTEDYKKKSYLTKKKNNSFNTSKPEIEIKKTLENIFEELKYQYRSKKYPFNCDFYIPKLDLYIELNFHWTHGKKPFENTEEDLKRLETWKEKAKTSKFYQNAIEVWTERDVKKRNFAKENDLNWIEFFSIKEFEEWINENI